MHNNPLGHSRLTSLIQDGPIKRSFAACIVATAFAFAPMVAVAATCTKPVIDKSSENFSQTASLIPQKDVTTCGLQDEYDSREFPRFYVDLDNGLAANSKHRASILELAFNLAKDSIERNELNSAELIYQIILMHYPEESRAMSSYGVVHIFREKYEEALHLLTQANAISPQDTIILQNLFVINTLLGRHKVAADFNRRLIKIEPSITEHTIHRLLLDALLNNKRDDQNWTQLLKSQSKENQSFWSYFDKALVNSGKTQNFDELINIGNQWIDVGMSTEAILLFDYVLQQKQVTTAHFLKAKAFEQGKHYKLAFQSAQSALKRGAPTDVADRELYGSILYETARLGYAAGEYERSLALLNEYKNRGYASPHLDYMFAVNLDASGKSSEALPYLIKCSNQNLPDFMHDFCRQKVASQAEAPAPETKPQSSKVMRIKRNSSPPSLAMRSISSKAPVTWLGKVITAIVSDNETTLNIRLIAQYLQPTTDTDIEDGKTYDISIAPINPADMFVVNMSFNGVTEEQVADLKSSITKEKFLVARGHTAYVETFNKLLIPGVAIEQAIFTSKITPHE
ncbi:MAG: tetratricopeptide repeat protein [Pseudomonadota bacterium]